MRLQKYKWCSKQSTREVARVDQERRSGSKLHASSETTKELSHKNVRNVSWTSEMSVGRQKNIKNVSWTSEYYILEYGEDITSVSRARKGS